MINKVNLLGRIGNKEYKATRNGSFICQLSIATSRKYFDSHGMKKEVTTWHNVNFFSKLADIANQYTNIGDLIYIEGEISNRKYEDNGVNRIAHSITGHELHFIPTGKKDNNSTKSEQNEDVTEASQPYNDIDDSSIPF